MKIAGTKTFDVYADPGHAWVKVSIKDVQSYDLAETISSYSYMRGGFAYLEEDCDLSRLLAAFKKVGHTVKFRERHGVRRSKIRGYACYNPAKIDWSACEVRSC